MRIIGGRDFAATLVCEECEAEEELKPLGYDDDNYHRKVIPRFKCPGCGKSRNELNMVSGPRPAA